MVCDLTARPIDLGALTPADQLPLAVKPASFPDAFSQERGNAISHVPPIPKPLPGADVKMLHIPKGEKRNDAIKRLFPSLPDVGVDPPPRPTPDGTEWTLARLQQIALGSSPLIRQAVAAVKSAEGAAMQAGLAPNPHVGYEGDTMGTGGSAGYNGAWLEQQIKTAGKLKLAQAAAAMDVLNAQLAFRRAQADLAYDVRNGYFAVLVAEKNLSIARVMVQFLDQMYLRQVELVLAGPGVPYEAAQLRGIAYQSRASLVQARNRYLAAWKRLATALGRPDEPLTELAGDIDVPVPLFEYGQALQWTLQNHTDVQTAENRIHQARYNLRLAQVTPIPDVDIRLMVQKDNTTLPHMVTPSVVLGVPLPLWNRNEGGIKQAQGNLMQQVEEPHRVRCALVAQLAEAFRRYRDGVAVLQVYQTYVIPDQARAYLHTFERHLQQPEVLGIADVVVAQQQLSQGIGTYVTTLGDLWTAVADISRILQTNDLYHMGDGQPLPTWEIPTLPDLPCCHPCSVMPPPTPVGADGTWPLVLPAGISAEPGRQ